MEDWGRSAITPDGKPSGEVRAIAKSYGFRWSPNDGAWQRQLNGNGEFAAKQCIEKLKGL